MKNVFFKGTAVFMAMVMLVTQTQTLSAKAADIALPSLDESALVLDEAALDEALAELNELDEYLAVNEEVTFADLESSQSELILNVDNSSAPLGADLADDPPLGIPSFLWGCILGVVGILLVYILTDGDKDETRKALWGMLVWVGVWVVGVVIYAGVVGSAAWY